MIKKIDLPALIKTTSIMITVAFLAVSRTPLTLAQEETESATPSTKESLKERIDKVVEEKKEEIKDKVEEMAQKKRGFIGRVERVSEESITLENRQGVQVIPLQENLSLIKKEEPIEIEDLAVDNWITVLGYQQEENKFSAVKLVVSEDNLSPRSQIVEIGSIVDYGPKQITIKTRQEETEIKFEINSQTVLKDLEQEEISVSDLFEEMQCLIAGYREVDDDDTDNQTNVALRIRSLAPINSD